MLRSLGRVSLFVRFGRWICVCMRKKLMDERLRAHIRPLYVAGLVCWCDRSDRD